MFHIVFISSTRADWGLLSPIARALAASGEACVRVVATNMHLLPRYGMTVDEIRADGFEPVEVDMYVEGDSPASRAEALGKCTAGMARALSELKPDAVVLLGDRYEILGAASAAAVMNIPIVHIAGGEISEGAVDDSFRHAITKLATLHLTATEPYRRRVVQLGEEPARVFNTGAIGVWNVLNAPLLSREELQNDLGFDLSPEYGPLAAITFHPATLDSGATPEARFRSLLAAIEAVPELRGVITYPNNDPLAEAIIPLLEDFAARSKGRFIAVKSLGMKRYLSLLRCASLCIGNSSSGIVEVPSFGIPTVDIGIRQRGRIAAESVIHCGDSAPEIEAAIRTALSPEFRQKARRCTNPYGGTDTLAAITDAILGFCRSLPLPPKKFYDLQ